MRDADVWLFGRPPRSCPSSRVVPTWTVGSRLVVETGDTNQLAMPPLDVWVVDQRHCAPAGSPPARVRTRGLGRWDLRRRSSGHSPPLPDIDPPPRHRPTRSARHRPLRNRTSIPCNCIRRNTVSTATQSSRAIDEALRVAACSVSQLVSVRVGIMEKTGDFAGTIAVALQERDSRATARTVSDDDAQPDRVFSKRRSGIRAR